MSYCQIHNLFLHCCEWGDFVDVKELHKKHKFNLTFDVCKPFRLACGGGQLDTAKWILKETSQVSDKVIQDAFYQSCIRNRPDVVEWIIKEFPNIDVTDEMFVKSDVEIVKMLCTIKDFNEL